MEVFPISIDGLLGFFWLFLFFVVFLVREGGGVAPNTIG